jgi:type I restriction enzyme S subunit
VSFPKYGDYKDSGIEWLGEVPSNWNVVPLKYICSLLKDGTHLPPARVDYGIPLLSVRNLVDGSFILRDDDSMISESSYEELCRGFIPQSQDVLLAIVGATLGKTALISNDLGPFHIQRSLAIFRTQLEKMLPIFLNLIFQSHGFQALLWELTGYSAQPGIYLGTLQNLRIPIPPSFVQKEIAEFVNKETAKIDELVAEQQRLIELLKEKRQAVISHAVTKGLNPDARMKPSGVESIGEVPEHWKVVSLKRIATVQTGIAKGKDYLGQATVQVPYLRVANVQDGFLDLDDVTLIEIPAGDVDRYRLQPGDVLMNEGGDFDKLGRGHIWEGQIDPCIHQNHVFAVRPKLVGAKWLNAITGSDYAQFYFMTRSKQSTNLASISSTNLMELPVVVPPSAEQTVILAFVTKSISDFDSLVAEAQRGIDLLQERRTALISAAVTGKIDVRDLK